MTLARTAASYGALCEPAVHPLAAALPCSDDSLRAEVVYPASNEGALHLDDVLARRTRTSIESWDRGVDLAPVVAELLGEVLGWSTSSASARSSTTRSGCRQGGTRSANRTTKPPTRPGSARRTSCPWAELHQL